MLIYKNNNVYEEALKRVRYLFDEFPNVYVAFSGGKDSTVILNLALQVATEKNRLPLKVAFIDQEAEWDMNIRYIRTVMSDPRVEPLWFQCPIKLFNATSATDQWLQCWEKGVEHLRPQEPNAITENVFGTDRFGEMFDAILKYYHPNERAIYLGGVRTEESPTRKIALTESKNPTYKWITWGKRLDVKRGHYTFYPIYDWSYTDVWTYITHNNIPYCELYDYMYRYGTPVHEMRVSNVHHETAVRSLFIMQEIERDNWNRLTKRLNGINTAGQLKMSAFTVKELPPAFSSWGEYFYYLAQHLIEDVENRNKILNFFEGKAVKDCLGNKPFEDFIFARGVTAVLKNDFTLTTLKNALNNPEVASYRQWRQGKKLEITKKNKYYEYDRAKASLAGRISTVAE